MRSAQTVAGKWLGPMSLPTAIAVAVMVLVLGWPVSAQVRAGASRQAPALHIVVIEGEDAVNIIQQKTAVAPVVEVRDRNDQPVAGAVVNFAIRNGRATFAGARTLSVTTNAAGRAVAAGFAPTGSGALQVSATAALQGQTAAAVTITQTTVQTAAQAAAVSGAGSTGGAGGAAGGGAGAGGGGLSATTLGIVGGAVAGGGAGRHPGARSGRERRGRHEISWPVLWGPDVRRWHVLVRSAGDRHRRTQPHRVGVGSCVG